MREYLKTQMFFLISIKLNLNFLEAKNVIQNLHHRFENDTNFDFSQLSPSVQDCLLFYISQNLYLDN